MLCVAEVCEAAPGITPLAHCRSEAALLLAAVYKELVILSVNETLWATGIKLSQLK